MIVDIGQVACVGLGAVGRSWAVAFARAGCTVALYDPDRATTDSASDTIARQLEAEAVSPDRVGTIVPVGSLAAALAGADYVQENSPENLPLKRALFEAMAQLDPAGGRCLYGSSTSSFVGSSFLEGLPIAERCLVVHPTNPPHLVPLTELCPSPSTSAGTLERVTLFMEALGQVPILVRKEIPSFILNRLQAAVLSESLALVRDGYVSPDDLDRVMKHGLGLRWSFMGPLETAHLNADGGFADYMAKFARFYTEAFTSLARDVTISPELVAEIDNALRASGGNDVAERQAWRDANLRRLRQHRATVESKN